MPDGTTRVRVAEPGDIPPGAARVVEVEGRSIAVCNVDGRYYGIDNTCPHRGGPLGEGDLEGAVIACPWHAWRWDVRTGANVNNPAVTLACYTLVAEADGVFVEL